MVAARAAEILADLRVAILNPTPHTWGTFRLTPPVRVRTLTTKG